MAFVHLNVHSTYSLLQAMPAPKALAKQAKKLKFETLAITEIGNVFSAVDAAKSITKEGLMPIMGAQILLEIVHNKETKSGLVTLLAQNKQGWQNVLNLMTQSNIASASEHHKSISLDQLSQFNENVILLTGGANYGILTPLCSSKETTAAAELLNTLKPLFENRLYIELQRHHEPIEQEKEPQFLQLAESLNLPVVATNDVRFLTPDNVDAYNVLTCIGEGVTIDDPAHRTFNSHYYLKSTQTMETLFADIPEAIDNTAAIANRCGYWPEQTSVKEMSMPEWPVEKGENVADIMRAQSAVGLEQRMKDHVFPFHPETEHEALRTQYNARLVAELDIIINMGFDGYFLITSDFIKWSKEQNIPVGPGRGSGAGSLVAWSLQITDLDPIRWNLYFERFLNPDRISLPDFDIDFCQERREEVIEYVKNKYGSEYVAQIITFGTLKAKACIRDVGRVLQLPYGLVGRIASFVPEGAAPPPIQEVLDTDNRLQMAMDEDEAVKELIETALQLEGCLRHASTHAAGVIIAANPIADVCGLYQDSRTTMPATQYSMYDAEFSGLVKFDFLGLKTLTTITYALEYARQDKNSHNVPTDILNISLSDDKTYDLLCAGQTVGIFQIESQGMTELAKQMQPKDMEVISALVALYRPGPMDLIPQYIRVRDGKELPNYPHPLLEDILKVSYGIPIYQEQVMQMARTLAGYSLGGADVLRRAMGKKIKAEMDEQRTIFVEGAAEHNQIPPAQANQIFDMMATFAGYGFNKAHSMAYALIAYQTAFVKANFPLPFMAATMTLDKGNTDKLMRYKQELQAMGYSLLPPCINESQANFAVDETGIRHALTAIKGAGEEAMSAIVTERKNGTYTNIWDFCSRLTPHTLTKKNLEVLIKSGALDCIANGLARTQLLENVDIFQTYCQQSDAEKNSNQIGLFGGGAKVEIAKPDLKKGHVGDTFTTLQLELQVIGFYLSSHPLTAFKQELTSIQGLVPINTLRPLIEKGKESARIAGMIMAKREMKTKSGRRMGFLSISDEYGQEEFVLFPDTFDQYQDTLETGIPYIFSLNIGADGDRIRLAIEAIQPLENLTTQRKSIILRAKSSAVLQPLQPYLIENGGMTNCKIILQQGNKEVAIELPHKITCSPLLLSQISALDGVEVLHI